MVPEAGFELTLPFGWRRLSLDGSDFDAIKDVIPPDSDAGQIMNGLAGQMAIEGLRLYAMDLRPESVARGYPHNLNVVVREGGGQVGIGLLQEILVAQLRSIDGFEVVDSRIADFDPWPAVEILSFITIPLADGSALETYAIQYAIPADGDLFIVTYSCSTDAVQACHDASFPSILSFARLPAS